MEAGGAPTRPDGVVLKPIHCRRCGYNLYGLPADGPCPECGLNAWESILHTVDPAASRLPRIRNPGVVGDALLWLLIFLALASALLLVRPVTQWFDAMDRSGVRNLAGWIPVWLPILAGGIGLLSLIWIGRLAPPAGEESGSFVWRDIRRLRVGLVLWALLVTAAGIMQVAAAPRWATMAAWLAVAVASALPLLGLRGVLRTIGLRSREYRTASGGRQGIRAMIVAAFGAAAGQLLRLLAVPIGIDALATFGIVTTSICALMVAIGLVYLVANAWWIRKALRCPPPRLEQVVGREN